MSSSKFKFVSPGVFLNEIDNSQLPAIPDAIGPIVIGRFPRGPAFQPVRVSSFSEFIEIFGNPQPGGQGDDVWREGNDKLAPTYASYAVQSYLRNSSPVNVVRLQGIHHENRTTNGYAGWQAKNTGSADSGEATLRHNAFALLVGNMHDPATDEGRLQLTCSVAAVFYVNTDVSSDEFQIQLSGTSAGRGFASAEGNGLTASCHHFIEGSKAAAAENSDAVWTMEIKHGTKTEKIPFGFIPGTSKFIRKVFNTNPVATNDQITDGDSLERYWLGETFEHTIINSEDGLGVKFKKADGVENSQTVNGVTTRTKIDEYSSHTPVAALVPFAGTNPFDGGVHRTELSSAKTGWFFSQHLGEPASCQLESLQKLFRFCMINDGADANANFKLSIEDIRPAQKDGIDPYGSFTVALRHARDTDNSRKIIERFSNCSLNPNSPDYIARKIGDTYSVWDADQKRYRYYGNYANLSKYIRVEMNADVDNGFTEPSLVPFGVYGPQVYKDLVYGDNEGGTGFEVTNLDASEGHAGRIQFAAGGDFADMAPIGIATRAGILDLGAAGGSDGRADGDAFTINVPTALGGLGRNVTVTLVANNGNFDSIGADNIEVVRATSDNTTADRLRAAINGTGDGAYDATKIKWGANITGGTTGLQGVTASDNADASLLDLTAAVYGAAGNSVALADTQGDIVQNASLAGGSGNDDALQATLVFDIPAALTSGGTARKLAIRLYDSDGAPPAVAQATVTKADGVTTETIAAADIIHIAVGGLSDNTPATGLNFLVSAINNGDDGTANIRVLDGDPSNVATGFGDITASLVSNSDGVANAGLKLISTKANAPMGVIIKMRAYQEDGTLTTLVPGYVHGERGADLDFEPPKVGNALEDNPSWLGDIEKGNTKFLTGSGWNDIPVNVKWPTTLLRHSASDGGLPETTKAYFGLQTVRKAESTRHDSGYVDRVRALADGAAEAGLKYSWIFSLDDVKVVTTTIDGVATGERVYYQSGSRAAGTSYSAAESAADLLNKDYNKFTSPFFGGIDGVNILESDPFNNRVLDSSNSPDEKSSYAYASVKRAIDSISDPEVVEYNMAAMPGITEPRLTTALVRNCEARGDALAVIDLPDVYCPPHEEEKSTFKDRLVKNVQQSVDALSERGINSSYGCAYYPWVKVYDEINDAQVWVPPSVVAMGVMANTEKKAALWFAPAGFNRGGLTEGSAGIPVLGVTERVSSKDRDKLYEANINPIASFPAEGLVVFGQKTLQISQSALDRINVRRLMIYVKKEISRISSRMLFDQNVQSTWDRFVGQVTPFLTRVKVGFGLTDFKVVLDSTTTTPDLVDRNVMYAKIFLKPARSIEFIAVDFVITNTGAAFED